MGVPGGSGWRRVVWTAAEDRALLDGVAARRRLADIAAELGRGLAATYQRHSRLWAREGLAEGQRLRAVYGKRHWSEADDAALLEDRAAGVTCAETGARLGRTERAIWHRLAVLAAAGRLPPRPPRAAPRAVAPAKDPRPVLAVPAPRPEPAAPQVAPPVVARLAQMAAVAVVPQVVVLAVDVLPGWADGFGGAQRDFARWLAGLAPVAGWGAADDHALAHDIFAGRAGPLSPAAVARFHALTAPLRGPDGRLPVTASAIAVPVLRARAFAVGVAA